MNRLAALTSKPQSWAPDLDPKHARTPRHEAQVALKEIHLLRDADVAVAPELADIAEPLVDRYQSRPTLGDQLRLPQKTSHDPASMRRSIRRVLATDTSAPGGSRDAVIAEAKMRRVFLALEYAAQMITRRAAEGAHR